MPIFPVGPSDQLAGLRELGVVLERVERTIGRIRYLRLKAELLEGVNPEINTDKQVLVSRMEQLGFRKQIMEAMEELDRKVHEAGKPLDFKACMDLARTIFEEIVEDAGRKAAAVKNHSLPPAGSSNFQPWYQLLVNVGALSGKEGDVLQKLYNFLSTEGAHQLESAPEQVRVAKNTVIEWGLLVVGRVQKLK